MIYILPHSCFLLGDHNSPAAVDYSSVDYPFLYPFLSRIQYSVGVAFHNFDLSWPLPIGDIRF